MHVAAPFPGVAATGRSLFTPLRCRSAACCLAKVARRALRSFTNQYLVRPQVSHHLEKSGQVIGTCTLEIQVRVPRPLAIILHHLLAVLSCLSLLC